MDEKLSSANTISEADLATAVPDPMAIPISAFFRAGASFTPSPVWVGQTNEISQQLRIWELQLPPLKSDKFNWDTGFRSAEQYISGTHHGRDLVHALQELNDLGLVGGFHTGEETAAGDSLLLLSVREVIKFTSRVRFAGCILIFSEDTDTPGIQ